MEKKISVILFSKGRPMQIHAYLESILMFSDIRQNNIFVLYREMEGIRYQKVINRFSYVRWIKEKCFEEDLKKIVKNSNEYIMFGCDDVVFTRNLFLDKVIDYLKSFPEMFGFSLRLGENIQPYPSNAIFYEGIMKWNWAEVTEEHYNYPWELDCTVYRKKDVEKIIDMGGYISNPNFLESFVYANNICSKLDRKYMACYQKHGCAIVITVNRVQDDFPNSFDDSLNTDIFFLDRLYNDEDNTLDITKISQMENDVVHVGGNYFILRHNTCLRLRSRDRLYVQSELSRVKKELEIINSDVNRIDRIFWEQIQQLNKTNGELERHVNDMDKLFWEQIQGLHKTSGELEEHVNRIDNLFWEQIQGLHKTCGELEEHVNRIDNLFWERIQQLIDNYRILEERINFLFEEKSKLNEKSR